MSENNYWTRLQRRSLSRRTMLRGAALGGAGLAGAALIGCGGDDDDSDGAGTGDGAAQVIEGGGAETIVRTEGAEEDEFDWIFEQAPTNVPISGGTRVGTYSGSDDHWSPFHLGGFGGGHDLIYDELFTQFFRGDHLVMLRGVERVERPDDLTNILTVRPGRMSPNDQGIDRAVNAADIFGAMRLKFEDITAWSPGLYAARTDWDQTEVTDDKTITLILSQPRNDFFIGGNTEFMAREIEDMHLSGEKTLQQWDDAPVASGPYYQTSFTPGSGWEGTKNPGFSQAPWPYIENRTLIKIPDPSGVQAQFRAGETHAFTVDNKVIFDDLLEDLASGDRPKAYGVKTVSQSLGVILALHGGSEPWTDIRAREAVSRALDVDRLIDVLEGGEAIKSGPGFSAFYANWKLPMDDPDVIDYLTHDPQRTRQLLDAVRADGSVDVDRDMIYASFAGNQKDGDRAVLMTQMLKEAGWNTRIETVTSQEMTTKVLRRSTCDFDITSPGYPAQFAQQLRAHHTVTQFVAECTNQMDPELDAMIEDFEATVDADELAEQAKTIERWLIKHWSVIKPVYTGFSRAMFKITLRNVNPAAISAPSAPGLYSWLDESYWPG